MALSPRGPLDPVIDLQTAYLYASRILGANRDSTTPIPEGLSERLAVHIDCIRDVIMRTLPDSSQRGTLLASLEDHKGMTRNVLDRVYDTALRLIPENASGAMPFSLKLYASRVVLQGGDTMAFSVAMEGNGVSGIGSSEKAHRMGLLVLLDLSGSMGSLAYSPSGGACGARMMRSRFSSTPPVPVDTPSGGQDTSPKTKRQLAIQSAHDLIVSLPDGSPVQLVGYASEAQEFFKGTPQDLKQKSLHDRIDPNFSGGTALASAIPLIDTPFFSQCLPHSITVLVITDGGDASQMDDGSSSARQVVARCVRGTGVTAPTVHGVSLSDPHLNLGQSLRKKIVAQLSPEAEQQVWDSVRVVSLGIGSGYREPFLRGLSGGFLSGLADVTRLPQTLQGFRALMGPREPFWMCVTLHQRSGVSSERRWNCLGALTDGCSQSGTTMMIFILSKAVFGRDLESFSLPYDVLRMVASCLDDQGSSSGVPKFYSLCPGESCLLTARTSLITQPTSEDSPSSQLAPVVLPPSGKVTLKVRAREMPHIQDSEPLPGALMAILHLANPIDLSYGFLSTPLPFSRDQEGSQRAVIDTYRKALNDIYFNETMEKEEKTQRLAFYEEKLMTLPFSGSAELTTLLKELRKYRKALEEDNQAILQQFSATASAHQYGGHRQALATPGGNP